MGCQLRCFLQLVLVACLLGTVRPSPKGEGSQPKRTEGKRSASSLKKKGAPHPTVPRSRLQASAVQQQPGPAAPSRPSLQGARPKAGGSDAAPVKSKPPSADAPAEEGELSMSERAALIGGLMLAPAGIGGFLLGCSIGGGGVLLYEKVSKGVHDALSEFKAKHQTEIEGGFRSFEQYAQLTEITVKAPSEELAAAYKQRLTNVLSQPHNRRCFDCTHCEDEMAAWASINLGIFICERCAGMHRALGTHKSRIKSAYADVWTLEMIERMEGLGNEKARELYGEAGGVRVSEEVDAEVLEVHVRDKYSRIKAAPGPLPSASGKLYRCEPLPGEDSAGEAAREPVQSGATEAEGTARQPALAAVPGPSVAKPKPKLASSARSASSSTTKPKPKKAAGSKAKTGSKVGGTSKAKKPKASTAAMPSAAR